MMHTKARTSAYPGTDVKRLPVPSEFVGWKVPFPEYKPVDYTSERILQRPPYADPEIRYFMLNTWNVNRLIVKGHDSHVMTSDVKDEKAAEG